MTTGKHGNIDSDSIKHDAEVSRLLKALRSSLCPYPLENQVAQAFYKIEQRVKSLEADAGRYRWLKPRLLGADFDWNEEGNCVLVFEMPNDATVSANCDETIDAAIKGATT